MRYEFLDHTADIKFKAYGSTLEELFKAIIYAFRDSITSDELKPLIEKTIYIEAKDLNELVYNLLDELIYLFDTESLIPFDVKSITINNNSLEVTLWFDTTKGKEVNGIKAVTFHELEVKKEKEWTAQVVLDV